VHALVVGGLRPPPLRVVPFALVVGAVIPMATIDVGISYRIASLSFTLRRRCF
jgi:hypothetical protein